MRKAGCANLVTQLYFKGDRHNATDEFIKPSLVITLNAGKLNGSAIETGVFDVVLAPAPKNRDVDRSSGAGRASEGAGLFKTFCLKMSRVGCELPRRSSDSCLPSPVSWCPMPKARIVVVEDESAIRRGVSDALRLSGYEVTEAADGAAGLREAAAAGVDLVLLDIMLPRHDGLEVLSELRRIEPDAARSSCSPLAGSEDDRVRGLKMGADDYVVKPFSAKELIARVRGDAAPHAEAGRPRSGSSSIGSGTIDLHRRELRWADGSRADLSETEAALLKYLVSNRERAVSREELLSRVWGIGTAGLETRAVDMHVARLRAKLKLPDGDDEQPEAIVTVRAHGYMAGPALSVAAG